MIPAFVAILTFALSAPIDIHAEDQVPALTSVVGPSWEETSAVEASRATTTVFLPDDSVRANSDDRIANALFGEESSGDGAVEVPRTQR
jgi:hypothetical protein